MATFTVKCKAGEDGVLHLDVPCGFPNAELDVTLTVQPHSTQDGWPADFFEKVLGGWQGEFPPLGDEGGFEDRQAL